MASYPAGLGKLIRPGVMITLLASLLLTAACARSAGPPAIPHAVTAELCVECHRTGKGGAPVQKHGNRGSCLNCHQQTR